MKCIKSILSNILKMSELEFPAYGSLYFSTATFLGASPVQRVNDPMYCIGPHCGHKYWDCNVGEPRYYAFGAPNRGPCKEPPCSIPDYY